MNKDYYPAGAYDHFNEEPAKIVGKDFLGYMIYSDDDYLEIESFLVKRDDIEDFARFLIKRDEVLAVKYLTEHLEEVE